MREIKFRAWSENPRYEIGDDGTVYSLRYKNAYRRQILHQYPDSDGYPYVFISVKGKRAKRTVHRMVALSFIPKPRGKTQVNHRNGIRHDNRVENLEWVTNRENVIHGFQCNGRTHSAAQRGAFSKRMRGEGNPNAKMNETLVAELRAMRAAGSSFREITSSFNISDSQARGIVSGKSWPIRLIGAINEEEAR